MAVEPGTNGVKGKGAVQLLGNVTPPDCDGRYGGKTMLDIGTLTPPGRLKFGNAVGIVIAEIEISITRHKLRELH